MLSLFFLESSDGPTKYFLKSAKSLFSCSNPTMAKVASILTSSNSAQPVPLGGDRTFDASKLFVTSFVVEALFLQLKGKIFRHQF